MEELVVTAFFYFLVFFLLCDMSTQPFDCQYTDEQCEFAEWSEGFMECVAVFQEQCPSRRVE